MPPKTHGQDARATFPTRYQRVCEKPAFSGWHRQAESSELGDGGFPVRRTIAKAYRP